MALLRLQYIKQRIADYGAQKLLASLPSPESLDWVPHSEATPPTALKIGFYNSGNILAFTKCRPDETHEIQYCSKPVSNPVDTSEIFVLSENEVMRLPLDAPFKYIAETSQWGKSRFSAIIEWYMMVQSESGLTCDYVTYCPRFYYALRKIEKGQKESEDPHLSLIEARTEIERHSIDCTTMKEATPTGVAEVEIDDLGKLRHYLQSKGALYLLENIPEADVVQFVDQKFLDKAQKKKLFIGSHAESLEPIYAYMRRLRKFHEIMFYVENTQRQVKITSQAVARQNVLHPFDKTYPKYSREINQEESARLTLMVKWYFIAARIAKDCVLTETKAYPERLCSALDYIHKRMGPAAVDSATVVDGDRNEDSTRSTSLSITGSRNPSTPAAVTYNRSYSPFISELAPPCPPTAQGEQQNDSHNTDENLIPRGTKRSADDAGFHEQIDYIDVQMQLLQIQHEQLDKQMQQLQMEREQLLKSKREG